MGKHSFWIAIAIILSVTILGLVMLEATFIASLIIVVILIIVMAYLGYNTEWTLKPLFFGGKTSKNEKTTQDSTIE